MRQIKASEVKPGMEIQWRTTMQVDGQLTPDSIGGVMVYDEVGNPGYISSDTPVTVLLEPTPAQPEEPTEFGAKVTVAGRKMIRCTSDPKEPWPWRGEALKGDPVMWSWGQLAGLGPVTVVPDQGWTAPTDAPEAPERIEQWDTWEDVPEGVAVTAPILVCHYRKNQGVPEFRDPKGNPDWAKTGNYGLSYTLGPWTRAADA